MAEYNLTSEELLLVYLTFLARDEENEHSEYFSQWFNNGGKNRLKDLFNSLKEKGIILKSYNPTAYVPNEIEFNKTFLKSWLKNSLEMGKELFNNYPSWLNIDGKYAPLRDISKKFSSLDECFFFYGKEIGHNPIKHKEVMDILNWAKENGYITFGICNFICSHQWESLKELKENPDIKQTADNICIVDE